MCWNDPSSARGCERYVFRMRAEPQGFYDMDCDEAVEQYDGESDRMICCGTSGVLRHQSPVHDDP